ncbi:MAG: glycosyltransferase family 2 protein [Pseudonocardiaceae bacterium]
MTEPFDTDSTSELPDAVGAANATTTDYIRYVRWREREKESRAIRMVELLPPTRPLPEFRFFGIVGTWMEEDIISASVSNAFHQGCEKVFLVDNGSSDQTVKKAQSSGATLVHSYRTDSYEEPLRIALMNVVMAEITEHEGAAHTWWLWFDADEFPHGPEGKPLKHHLASLDARYRVVGARYFHHFPASLPHYLPPYHPIHFQSLCYEQRLGGCGHRKHPLVRLDRGRPPVMMYEGFHRNDSSEVLFEPSSPAFIHHFPFRAREVTRRRMITLCEADGTDTSRIAQQDHHEIACYGAPSHSSQRFALFDAVYAGDWNFVAREMPGQHSNDVVLHTWADAFEEWEVDVWYSKTELLEATQHWQAQPSAPANGQGRDAMSSATLINNWN